MQTPHGSNGLAKQGEVFFAGRCRAAFAHALRLSPVIVKRKSLRLPVSWRACNGARLEV